MQKFQYGRNEPTCHDTTTRFTRGQNLQMSKTNFGRREKANWWTKVDALMNFGSCTHSMRIERKQWILQMEQY
jgi:hypothetical protein